MHIAIVGRYSADLATALEGTPLALSPKEAADLKIAAQCYDAGKLVVPNGVWDNPGKPSPEDWQQMCRHPLISTEASRAAGKPIDEAVEKAILSNGTLLGDNDGARAIVRHHHEKLDGTGYPDRLQGQDIPKAAQLLGITDMFDALTNPRSFRPAKSYEQASEILRQDAQAGKLNAGMVEVFLAQVVPNGETLAGRLSERQGLTEAAKDECLRLKQFQKQDAAMLFS